MLVLLALPVGTTHAGTEPPTRTARIRRIEAGIHVDGPLDELVWHQLSPITDFVQTEPEEGVPATEGTEVFLFYDNDKIYLGFKCYDSEPNTIVARSAMSCSRNFPTCFTSEPMGGCSPAGKRAVHPGM